MTDQEIIDYIKKDIVEGNTADFITLDIYDSDKCKKECYSEPHFDEMMTALFDFSMTKNIVGIRREFSRIQAYNGQPCAITTYIISVGESEDGTTNITPRLMKFIEVAFTRAGLDRLAYPMYRNRIEYEVKMNPDRNPILYILPPDPWEVLESYMEE